MKILITGANGFLARHLLHFFQNKNQELFSITKNEFINDEILEVTNFCCDITNETEVKKIIDAIKPNVVVHCAAMSKPDDCENNKQLCLKTNVDATKYLTENSIRYNAHFIFTSTDFIFGEGNNHKEEDDTNPPNFYAESKILAEQIVKQTTDNYTIIRPVFMYGKALLGARKTFVQWVQNSLQNNVHIKVVNDQFRTPVFIDDICKAIETIIVNKKTGIYNLGGSQIITPYEMAVKTALHLGLNEGLIEPVTENNFNELVKRAKRSILNIDKAKQDLDFNPLAFDEGIKECF